MAWRRLALLWVCAGLSVPAAAQVTFPSSPHAPIPSMAPDGVLDSVVVDAVYQGFTTDVDVALTLTHTWTGDLVVDLTAPWGETVTLMHRPGAPGTVFGCSGDDPDIVADDEGIAGSIENDCQSGTGVAYMNGARYTPEGLLATFDGLPANGYWKLRVADIAGVADIGTFETWALIVTGLVVVDSEEPAAGDGPSLRVRPNPVQHAVVADLALPAPSDVRVELVDVTGRVVSVPHLGPLRSGRHTLWFRAPAPGVYLLRAMAGELVIATPVTVLR